MMKWYHKYLLHPGQDRTEGMIHQDIYWSGLRKSVQREVTGCDTYQHTKQLTTKYGKLPATISEETPWNKLCVDLLGPCKYTENGKVLQS